MSTANVFGLGWIPQVAAGCQIWSRLFLAFSAGAVEGATGFAPRVGHHDLNLLTACRTHVPRLGNTVFASWNIWLTFEQENQIKSKAEGTFCRGLFVINWVIPITSISVRHIYSLELSHGKHSPNSHLITFSVLQLCAWHSTSQVPTTTE